MKNWKATKHTAGTLSFQQDRTLVEIQTFKCELTALLTSNVDDRLIWFLPHLPTYSLPLPPNSMPFWGVWVEVRIQHVAGRAQHQATWEQWWKGSPRHDTFCEYLLNPLCSLLLSATIWSYEFCKYNDHTFRIPLEMFTWTSHLKMLAHSAFQFNSYISPAVISKLHLQLQAISMHTFDKEGKKRIGFFNGKENVKYFICNVCPIIVQPWRVRAKASARPQKYFFQCSK